MDAHTTHGILYPPTATTDPQTSASSDSDDVWGDDLSDGEFHRTMADREYQRMEQAHKDAGYREGIIEGKDLTMQSGFDDGYATGSQLGLLAGRITGKLRAAILAAHLVPLPLSSGTRQVDLVDRGNELLSQLRSSFGSLAAVFSPAVVQQLYKDYEVSAGTEPGRARARQELLERWNTLQAQVDEYSREVRLALAQSPVQGA